MTDDTEKKYSCAHAGCKVLRTVEEGGNIFTVCDEHWDALHKVEKSVTSAITAIDEDTQKPIKEQRYRVRYGRDKHGYPKNTLATVQEGDIIYFGIARCKSKVDRAKKKFGTMIAVERMLRAKELGTKYYTWRLYGAVKVGAVKELLEYFRNIDKYPL